MPIYEYQCAACGKRHEVLQKFSDVPLETCPHCGENQMKRLVSATAFHLKGSGWYVTDFKDKKTKKEATESEPNEPKKSESPDIKTEPTSTETKKEKKEE